jgi:hypothetical protein
MKIKIIQCTAWGPIFANLTPGSIHKVIEPPKHHKPDKYGVWVQGIGEPVKVLNGTGRMQPKEYEVLPEGEAGPCDSKAS